MVISPFCINMYLYPATITGKYKLSCLMHAKIMLSLLSEYVIFLWTTHSYTASTDGSV
jgi:hypothetical protein